MRIATLSNVLRLFHHKASMPLKFAANVSMIFTEQNDLLQRYRSAKEAGFKGVECVFPYDVPADQLSKVREQLGIEQTLINTYMGNRQKGEMGFASIPGKEKEFNDSLELSIKYCKALSCKSLHIMSGKIPAHEEHQKTELLNQMEETYVKNLKAAVPRLEKEGILALIEPMNTKISFPNYFMNTVNLALRVIERVGHQNLKLQFDFFHVQIMHGNLTKTFKDNFEQVGYIQISQPPHRGEPDSAGEIDYNYIFSFLEKMGYSGWIGAEYVPTGKSEESLEWFQKFK